MDQINGSNLRIMVCPFCFDYKMMYQLPISPDAEKSFENHIDKCPVRRKNRLYDTINVVIDENRELLEKLKDE